MEFGGDQKRTISGNMILVNNYSINNESLNPAAKGLFSWSRKIKKVGIRSQEG